MIAKKMMPTPVLAHTLHCAKVQKQEQGKQISNFLIHATNNVVEIMGKEFKSCKGVLLRTDLTGHGQFSQSVEFCQKLKRVGWLCLLQHFQHRISKIWRPIQPCYIPGLSHSVPRQLLSIRNYDLISNFPPCSFWLFLQN